MMHYLHVSQINSFGEFMETKDHSIIILYSYQLNSVQNIKGATKIVNITLQVTELIYSASEFHSWWYTVLPSKWAFENDLFLRLSRFNLA